MKYLIILFSALVIAGCNLQETTRAIGDSANSVGKNAAKAVKEVPKEIGDATNKAADDIQN